MIKEWLQKWWVTIAILLLIATIIFLLGLLGMAIDTIHAIVTSRTAAINDCMAYNLNSTNGTCLV